MRLTTRSSYGIRALINLAIAHGGERVLSIKHISRKEGISGVYLEQIFNRLKRRGLIKSIRGPKGGYVLAKDPAEVSIYEVVMALEGGVFPGRCVSRKGEKKMCEKTERCASKEVWDEVAMKIKETLGRFSLRDLARRTLEMNSRENEKERA